MTAMKIFSEPVRLAAFVLAVMVLLVLAGPLFLSASYGLPGPLTYAPPSMAHPCGTDMNGRDLLFRIMEGGEDFPSGRYLRGGYQPLHWHRLWTDRGICGTRD